MTDKIRNLAVRTISGLILAIVTLVATWWSQWSFGILLGLLAFGGIREFYDLARKHGADAQEFIGLTAGMVLFVLNFTLVCNDLKVLEAGWVRDVFGLGMAFFLLLLPLVFFCELWRKKSNPAANIGVTFMSIIYVAVPFSLMCYFPILTTKEWSPEVMLGYIFVVWANDSFAYLVGMTLGRHKLFERISPKKSWEGFFGGLVGACITGMVIGYVLDASVLAWGGLAIVASVTGVLGDLVESMFKRAAEVKDSGELIPGHGGVLDRFDAMLLSSPFVFVYMIFVM